LSYYGDLQRYFNTNGTFLSATVEDFIHDHQWHIPFDLEALFPNIRHFIDRFSIPLEHKPDVLVWNHTDTGNLSLKEAYSFKSHHSTDLHWAKLVWSKGVLLQSHWWHGDLRMVRCRPMKI
jgi:hypothetical protein